LILNWIHLTTSGQTGTAGANTMLGTVNCNTAAASAVLTIYNGTSASGTVVAVIDCSRVGSHWYGVRLPAGLYYALSGGNADVTLGIS